MRILTILLFLLAMPLPSIADSGKVGRSVRSDLFFAFEHGGLISFDEKEKMQALERHCSQGKPIFAEEIAAQYKCKLIRFKLDGETYSDQAEIQIYGTQSSTDEEGVVFLYSTRKLRQTNWVTRPLSIDEIAALQKMLGEDRNRYGNMVKQLEFNSAVAVTKPDGVITTYILPGKKINDEDAFYEAQRHHVFLGTNGHVRYQGQLPDKPQNYYDINGDDIPELQTQESCDGICIELWDVQAKPKSIANLVGH